MKISKERMIQLERAERKLLALEAGGVDNWEGFDYALEDWYKEAELEEKIEDFMITIQETLCESAYEPSERGAGIAFDENSVDNLHSLLIDFCRDIMSRSK